MRDRYDYCGIAYETWRQVSRILATWTTQECMDAWDELRHGFMTPQIERLQVHPDSDYLEEMGEDPNQPGFYCRLSASGYLDCTDWSGPFQSEEEAVADLLQTYADEV